MATAVGRLAKLSSTSLLVLGDNTVRGAAGAAILNAELLAARNLI